MTDFATIAADVHLIREALDAAPVPPVPPAVLPPVGFVGTHWVSGRWTNPGQLGEADRVKMWQDDYDGTRTELLRLMGAGVPTLFGGDLNTPAKDLPELVANQVFLHNTSGYDKLIYVPNAASPYELRFGKVESIDTPSDHPLLVVPVTLLLDGVEVLTCRFGTCNVRHDMTAANKRATIQAAHDACDVVVWQETDTPAANALIDDVFPPTEWHHMFDRFETDMSVRKSMFDVIEQHYSQISDGVAHVSPNRYVVSAVCRPIPQTLTALPSTHRFAAALHAANTATTGGTVNPLTYIPAKYRAIFYALYTVVGLALGGISVYDASINAAQPAWLIGSLAVFGYVGVATGATALSNVGATTPSTGSHAKKH